VINPGRKFIEIENENISLFVEDIDPNVGRFRNLVQTTVIVPKVCHDQKFIIEKFLVLFFY
jgi:hypothetical protein